MALGENLKSEVGKILRENWTTRQGRKIPEYTDVKLSDDAVTLNGAVLYADLDNSTKLVDSKKHKFAAEMYKCYLVCAARIIRSEQGEITAYDGDRVMAVFIGVDKETRAARTALKINHAVKHILNPAIRGRYPNTNYSIKQVVGIDTSELFIARTGIRGANDLVWIGRAANYAAKLAGRNGAPTQITADVFKKLDRSLKVNQNGGNMWSGTKASKIGKQKIYWSKAMLEI